MGLDIRFPIGGMFTILGLLLAIYGVATNGDAMYARSLSHNVNLYWGLVMLAFGLFMLVPAWLKMRAESAAGKGKM